MLNQEFIEIKNPYVVGNPVKSADMFFGREEDFVKIQEWVTHEEGSHAILLIGGRRSGKTSILYQIREGRLKNIGETVWCDFHDLKPKIKNDESFLLEIAKSILKNPSFEYLKEEFLNKIKTVSVATCLQVLLEECLSSIKPKKIIFLFDEIEPLEALFQSGTLTENSLFWIKQALNQSVYFIMTSSHEYRELNIRGVFGDVSETKTISELSTKDTFSLIQKPCKILKFQKNTLEKIYRLSGGFPFYVQLICSDLITQVNHHLKRTNIEIEDLNSIIKNRMESPHGHIQETWKALLSDKSSKKNMYALAALANSIRKPEEYVSFTTILKTATDNNFSLDKNTLNRAIAWIKSHTRLLEWEGLNYRFRTDLLRLWIAHEFQIGDDIDEYINEHLPPEKNYIEHIKELVIEANISFEQRANLDLMAKEFGFDYNKKEELEDNIRKQNGILKIDWVKEYKYNCEFLKEKYSDNIPRKNFKLLKNVYVKSGRVSIEKAREVDKTIGIYKKNNTLYVFIFMITIAIAGIIYIYFNENPLKENSIPFVINDNIKFSAEKNIRLEILYEKLLENFNDADGDKLTIKDIIKGSHGEIKKENNKIVFIPKKDFIGEDTFQFNVSDNKGGAVKASALIIIINPEVETKPEAEGEGEDKTASEKQKERWLQDFLK